MNDLSLNFSEILKEKCAIEKAAKLHWLHWVVVIGSLIVTFGAWHFTKQQVEEKTYSQFIREAKQATELISERLAKYEDALWSGVAAIHSQSHGIDYDEWKRFSNTLSIDKKYPGINGIGLIYYAPNKTSLDKIIEHQRETRPAFSVHPAHDKSEYWPITYIEPMETNARAVGLDVAHEHNRYTAAIQARDTGKAQITGPIILVQDQEKQPGFLFYAPFYNDINPTSSEQRQNTFTGLVYAPFIFKKLMQGTLEKEKRRVGIEITDNGEKLYNEHIALEPDYDPDPIYKKKFSIVSYGRIWVFDIWSTKSFKEATHNNQPKIILIGGIAIDSLLLAFFIFLSRSNQRAIKFSTKLTDAYKTKNNELETSIDKLSESNEELERFAYIAAHDMQEPLRMITSFSSLLESEYKDQLDETGQEFLHQCSTSATRMKSILDDLLEYSRVGTDAEKLQIINTNAVIKGALDNLNESIKETDAEITTSNFPDIYANPVRFGRLIQNLVGNGIKYQSKDNKPHITIDLEEKDDEWVFSIKDNGIGIRQEYQNQIFEPFKRLHNRSEYPGTGIGLAICSKIVKTMNGKLWVQSEGEKGSTFYFTAPKHGMIKDT